MVAARLAEVVLRDERAVIPIGSYNAKYGLTLSMPSIVGRAGVVRILEPDMTDEERQALQRSARRSERRPPDRSPERIEQCVIGVRLEEIDQCEVGSASRTLRSSRISGTERRIPRHWLSLFAALHHVSP